MATLPLRRFADPACPIATDWYREPFYTGTIRKDPDTAIYSTTADGSCSVALDGGHNAYIKPNPAGGENKLLVAREKIAADLGYVLELPVAPIAVHPPSPGGISPYYSAVSLVCLQGGRTWGEGGANHLHIAAEALEALRVFWTWIGDTDHENSHPGNVLYDVLDNGCAVVSIDHARCLCWGNGADPMATPVVSGYGSNTFGHVVSVCRETVGSVETLSDSVVEPIVRRLDALLRPEEQDVMLNILRERKKNLRAMLGC